MRDNSLIPKGETAMSTSKQTEETALDGLRNKEPGVAELMEFYERVEAIYIDASMSISETDIVYTVDTSNLVDEHANLGRN